MIATEPNAVVTAPATTGITDRAWEIYHARLRPIVETEANIGKLIIIDPETGDYEIATDPTLVEASSRLRVRQGERQMAVLRIGYDATFARKPSRLNRLPLIQP